MKGKKNVAELKLLPLRSSSKGNSTIISGKSAKILVDCGISGKALDECLASVGILAESIDGIVVTHEHTDHIKGIGIVSRKYDIPVYANASTWHAIGGQLGKIRDENKKIFETGSEFYIKDIKIQSFHTSHDAAESVGYTFEIPDEKVSVATDMGKITDDILNAICGSHTVLIEANYDLNMLEIGPYPYELKRRIKGDMGHLCNDDCADLAKVLAKTGTRKIFLGHLSEENNFPGLALKTVENCLTSGECPIKNLQLAVMAKDGRFLCAELNK
ncbi:MAG: MBL fold metallo-hydrolase [Clostridia bacterium]|nr:MBL fold metallo-hydrolase [Clostridia bacterium]